ncbi:MAG TPA: RNA polymerase sigma factor [Actinomycetota bacterium]|nr:RNA polymerase sigma factor [Actinomycetota bacterium]
MQGNSEPSTPEAADPVLALYDRALPQVYGYLLPRCGSVDVAEDLTAETFLAAVAATRDPEAAAARVDLPWLIGVARHKLVDHWRRAEREDRLMAAAAHGERHDDPWEAHLDAASAHAALARLNGFQRAALVLHHVDGLPVGEVAAYVGRSVHATETLLVRARAALRHVYEEMEAADD